jgi:Tfp pilus assembly protein PilO
MDLHPPSFKSISHNPQVTGPLSQSILLVVVIVLFTWFLLIPKYNSTQEQHATLKGVEQQRAAVDNDKKALESLIVELNDSKKEVRITDEALPLVGRISRLDLLLDSLAKSSGLQVAQINPEILPDFVSAGNREIMEDPFAASRSLQTTDVSMLVTGTIDQFRNFLQLLETSGRVLDVSELEITTAEGVNRYRLTIKAYAYEVSASDEPVGAPLQ